MNALISILTAVILVGGGGTPEASEPLTVGLRPSNMEALKAGQGRTVWDSLADCESGLWDRSGTPIVGSADWSYDGRDYGIFEGGLNWLPSTWLWLTEDMEGFPDSAVDATREQEIVVAEKYRSLEVNAGRGGFNPWPVCASKLGLPR